ncbi:MAG: prepilin-type N-terminal cleavage/methylation domain-containing protein [Campylobacterota bacterium]|nr:prepilin-type N-terminal cleavage/methylation domain-containing protein [Campylobacterota bacterium]
MKRAGFTMIELIFVIVILGILAAVAIPKLAATRDDAKISGEMTSVKQALQNLGAEYTAQGAFTNYTVAMANTSSKCFDITAGTNAGDVDVAIIAAATTDGTCDAAVRTAVISRAVNTGITAAAGASKTYVFAGDSVRY